MATHYLRDHNSTLVDIEAMKHDINCVVIIPAYSNFLLNSTYPQAEVIADFYALQEIRAEYFECPVPNETPDELASRRLREIAAKYQLWYSTD